MDQFMFVSDNVSEVIDSLSSLMQKKIVRPEVYDIVDKIMENLITNYSISIQKSCKNAFINFLIHYPMSDKIIKKYALLLTKNLDYNDDNGRALVIETLQRMCEVLPED